MQNKSHFRKQAKQERLAMSLDEISAAIISKIIEWPVFQQAHKIACYSPLTHEMNLLPLMTQFADSKQWYLPRIASDTEMIFVPWQPTQLMTSGRFGILEPVGHNTQTLPNNWGRGQHHQFDLVILPALMVDHAGNRLGHGKGYYDRFLASIADNCIKVTVVPNQHFVGHIPFESHDIGVQFVVTEEGLYEI